MSASNNGNALIAEALKKIVLGRSKERIDMSAIGTGGVGTARMIHGYVAKIHDNPADEEYSEYAGTIDVGEFPDETASSEPIVHKGVLLSGALDNSNGFLIIPTLNSDVTIVSDSATKYMYVLSYSHAKILQLDSHQETSIGVTETEELDPDDNDSPDYDLLEKTGKQSKTTYTAGSIVQVVKNTTDGKESGTTMTPASISSVVDNSSHKIEENKIESEVNGMAVTISDQKITFGAPDAIEPLVLGEQLATLMDDFITQVASITVPTMMGTMPIMNMAQVTALKTKIALFKSQISYTK